PVEEAARDDAVPALGERPVDLAEQDAVAAIDEPGRVAEGGRLGADGGAGRVRGEGGSARDRRPPGEDQRPGAAGPPAGTVRCVWRLTVRTARAICFRRKYGIDRNAAIDAWTIRLPAPGSMYARNQSCMVAPSLVARPPRPAQRRCYSNGPGVPLRSIRTLA